MNSRTAFGLATLRLEFEYSRNWISVPSLLCASTNLDSLAYAAAKTYGLTEECASILEATGLTEEDIKLPTGNFQILEPPQPIAPAQSNWPVLPSSSTILEKALSDEFGDLTIEEPGVNGHADVNGLVNGIERAQETDLINVAEDGESWEDVGEPVGGWDMGEEVGGEDVPLETTTAEVEGLSIAEYWVRNSPLAADHVAAGSFDSAMQLLHRQIGAVNFEPLKPKFLQIYQSARAYLEANPGLPPLELYVRRNQGDRSRSLPRLPWDFEKIKTTQMREALRLVTANKVDEAIVAFRDILLTLLLYAASNKAESDDVLKTVETIREYIVALSVETTRRGLDVSTPEGIKRNLELAAYFTNFNLIPQHKGLALMQAMTQFNKYKNSATAAVFAQNYIALGVGKPDALERVYNFRFSVLIVQANRVIAVAQRNTRDAIEIDYDQFAPYSVCAASFTPIYKGSPSVSDPFTGALYKPEYKGQLDRVSGVTEIGAPGTGFRVLI